MDFATRPVSENIKAYYIYIVKFLQSHLCIPLVAGCPLNVNVWDRSPIKIWPYTVK